MGFKEENEITVRVQCSGDELKKEINNTNIPFAHSNYFVKKAEEELEKIKNGEC